MDIDSFLELVKKRRSIRRFKPDEVPEKAITNILEAARWAMSGANAQPWEFVVVRNKDIRQRVMDSWLEPNLEAFVIEQTRIPELRHHHLRDPLSVPSFRDAPVIIVMVGDKRTYQATVLAASFLATEGAPDAIYFKNMANATQLLHLAAAAQGLGSEWISVNRPWGQALKAILGIPEILEVQTLAAVGYPAYTPGLPFRRPLKDIAHFDHYDRSKARSAKDIYNFLAQLRKATEKPYKQGL
jgi:5,6-dimethylbenzimidazole synthase